MFIQEVELFQGIPSHIIDEIAELITQESNKAGRVLFQEDDFADYLYILEEGEINLTIQGEKYRSFSVDKTGLVFGWSSLVEPRRYTAAAECVKESKVIKIDADRLMRVFERHPAEGLKIMRRLAGVMGVRLVKCYQELIASRK
ncbi:MAG TPA: cyclic nucleotide-binding domain-containing protein [Syntrophales bacterium]|nr:cyclic nucleotide-binding domain-containing protein [Syntrophales bacterium]